MLGKEGLDRLGRGALFAVFVGICGVLVFGNVKLDRLKLRFVSVTPSLVFVVAMFVFVLVLF
jgi:hypothetical protein